MFRRLMVLLTVLGVTVGFGQNLVLNGDFEAWTANAPDSWTTIESGITVSAEDNPAFFHGGSWSMKTEVTTGDQGSTDFRQSLDVVSGETYDVSVWIYHADDGVQARLFVGDYRGYSDNSIVGAWQEMTYSYTATATGSIEVGLRFYDQSTFDVSSTLYIDDYTMVVGVPPVPTAYTITEIQTPDEGGDASQYSGEFIETSGIVTAIGGYFYFIQDGDADYSGVYVYDGPGALALGDSVTIIGNVAEYNGLTQISDVSETTLNSSGNALPAARVLTTGTVGAEINEGMLVYTAGECTAVSAAPGTDRWLFQLDDGSGVAYSDDGMFAPTTSVGTDYEITGVLTYYYNNFQVLTRDAADVVEVVVVPTVAAPTPSRAAADVISVFSDAYTDLAGTDFNPWWWQATVQTFEDIEANSTLKYESFNYQGTQLDGGFDVTLMDSVHFDLWTDNEPAVNVWLNSLSTGEQAVALTPTLGAWTSYDVPLAAYMDLGLVLNDIHQFKFDGGTGGTIYLDNIYFFKAPAVAGSDASLSDLQVAGTTVAGFVSTIPSYHVELPYASVDVPAVTAVTTDAAASYVVTDADSLTGTTEVTVTAADASTTISYSISFSVAEAAPLVAADTPTTHADSVLSIYSDTYTNLAETNFNPNWGQSTAVTVDQDAAGSNTLLYTNLNYQGTNLGGVDGVDQDFSGYDSIHIDFWTPNATTLNFFLISRTTGEQAFALPVTNMEWVSVDIPLTHFTDLGMGLADIFQFKVDGGDGSTVVYFDNWYFYNGFEVITPPEIDITGSWSLAPIAGALMVGPNPNDGSWWSSSEADVAGRACIFDDEYVFNADGSFQNVLGDETWVEAWQGAAADGCAAPVAPHDASNAATWTYDAIADTLRLDGVGAYLGIPKAITGGELSDPADAPASVTYNITMSDDLQEMTLVISTGGGYWTFALVRTPPAIVGTWVLAPEAGALMVGPNPNDGSWWSSSADDVMGRACIFDDEYVFNADGSFMNILGDETWVETWQGAAADGCAAPVAPHDGSVAATWTYNETAGTVTLDGTGAYLGIPKAITGGELSDPADAPESITYETTLSDNDMTMTLVISTGGGYWTFKLVDINSVPVVIPVPLVAAPVPTAHADSVLSIYSDAYENLAETNFNPNWGQSTVVTIDSVVAESNVLLYENLNYQGTNLGGADGVDQDLTIAEYLHIDFWTPNATALNFVLISRTTGEQAYALPVATEEWVSVEIPLSHFTDLGLGLSDIYQFKVDGGDGNTIVYFDNIYFGGIAPVSVDGLNIPESFALHQNYPNPFNPSTTIRFDMPTMSNVKIVLFDVQGREVAELVNKEFSAGQYQTIWNGQNAQGTAMPAGIYFARMITSEYASTVKMLLIK